MGELTSNIAVITGAASGIGKASALALASKGAKVALFDIDAKELKNVQAEIENSGGEAIAFETDVSDPESIKYAIEQTVQKWEQIDIAFVNAGINGRVAPIETLSPLDWNTTIETNLRSTFLTVHYCVPFMKKNGGSIVITSSINGNRTFSNIGMSAYSTSKAGQVAFGKMAALELAKYKIRVNMICPGSISTNIDENTFPDEDKLKDVRIPVEYPKGNQPLENKPGEPEQVADLVCFLSSKASSHITGTKIYIDGAESLL
ncbi:SDR family oxidoreductase [Niallia sp. 03133]|uniref:SDR family oxidoreductase n=1 Tax=Niallia sp. 03133 TaxID=3458060 RepID=UPI0040445B50